MTQDKICTLEQAINQVEKWQSEGKKSFLLMDALI
jgi:hypothetical protein